MIGGIGLDFALVEKNMTLITVVIFFVLKARSDEVVIQLVNMRFFEAYFMCAAWIGCARILLVEYINKRNHSDQPGSPCRSSGDLFSCCRHW